MIRQHLTSAALTMGLCCMIAGPAGAQETRTCDQAKHPSLEYYECESRRLEAEALSLDAQARAQLSQGGVLGKECNALEDSVQIGNCNMLSSDIITDARFKRAEAIELMEEAGRMSARAADLRKAGQN